MSRPRKVHPEFHFTRFSLFRLILIVILGFGVSLLGSVKLMDARGDPAQAVVRIVSLDKQNHPQRQGLGVVVDSAGLVLTSASLLIPEGAIVVLTGRGAKYLVQKILYENDFQDIAVLKVEADQLSKVDVGLVERVYPGEAVRIGLYQDKGLVLQEALVAKVYPLSSRLILVKLDPSVTEAEPGAPLFDSRGNVVGLVHAFGAAQGAGAGFKTILALGRGYLPREIWLEEGKKTPEQENDGRRTRAYPPEPPNPLNFTPEDHRTSQAPDKNQPTENRIVEASGAFWRGVRAGQEQKWQEAQEEFTASLAAAGKLAEAHFGRGLARYNLKNYEGAVQDFLQANQQLPNYALASLWLGKSWERLNNTNQAQKAYQQAVNQDPDLKEAWFYLGVQAYQQGNLAQAQKFLERSGDNINEAARRAYYLGAIARSQGRHEQARKAFAEAIERDEGLNPAYLEQGKTLLDLGQPKKAAQILNELIQRDPELPIARYYLALAHQAAWNTKEAWKHYLVLQRIDPALASRLLPILEKGP